MSACLRSVTSFSDVLKIVILLKKHVVRRKGLRFGDAGRADCGSVRAANQR